MANTSLQPHDDPTSLRGRLQARPLLRRVMERQGIDPMGSWWQGMEALIDRIVRRCAACEHTSECQSWLAKSASRASPPDFCRNRHVLIACRTIAHDSPAAPRSKRDDKEPEAALSCVMGDPLVRLLMTADGVDQHDLRRLLDKARTAMFFSRA
jgi:hypothetical protein